MHLYVTNTGISNVKKTVKTFLLILKRCVTTLTVKTGEQCAETFFDCHDTNLFLSLFLLEFINHVTTGEKKITFFGAKNLPLKTN